MAKGGVGFASSVNQTAAAQEKKKRKRANIPETPEIKATVAKIRANGAGEGKPAKEVHVDHALLRESWQEIVAVMKSVRPAPVKPVAVPADKPPVVFETFVQAVEETAPVKPSPLPEKVVVVDVPLLLLPPVCERVNRARAQRRWNKFAQQFKVMRSGAVIALPDSMTGDYADRKRIRQRIIWEKFDNGEWQADDFCPQRPPRKVAESGGESVNDGSVRLSYASAYSGSLAKRNR